MVLNVGRREDRIRNTAHRRRIVANGDTKFRMEVDRTRNTAHKRRIIANRDTKCRKKGRQKNKHSLQEKNNPGLIPNSDLNIERRVDRTRKTLTREE